MLYLVQDDGNFGIWCIEEGFGELILYIYFNFFRYQEYCLFYIFKLNLFCNELYFYRFYNLGGIYFFNNIYG